jgi:hypothetical protein
MMGHNESISKLHQTRPHVFQFGGSLGNMYKNVSMNLVLVHVQALECNSFEHHPCLVLFSKTDFYIDFFQHISTFYF